MHRLGEYVFQDSVQRVLAGGAQRLYTGHGGPLPRPGVAKWLEQQYRQDRSIWPFTAKVAHARLHKS